MFAGGGTEGAGGTGAAGEGTNGPGGAPAGACGGETLAHPAAASTSNASIDRSTRIAIGAKEGKSVSKKS